MAALAPELRSKLEGVIVKAREAAEAGAKTALEALAVHHHEPYSHMDTEARRLRTHLRARARQLGDQQERSGRLELAHLIQECAYEHWHRMLFARFLAENDLLIEPEMQVAISLDEAEELAREIGEDMWAFASRCAQYMLPQIFRPEDPLLRINFAREHRLKLENLLDELETAVFTADDSLGWVYQFWQAKKKDEVNRSEVKIGADELPAVTQLFTEPYMVQFLLHNSLGAWWVSHYPDKSCPVELTYLRMTDEGSPAAGNFDGWPDDLSRFRLLDPCCGSGHFLVSAFLMLVPMRMMLEDLSPADAADSVLRENLHGLELDLRCVAIAAFALALEAWRFPDAGGYRSLPRFNLAWCGQPVTGKREQWLMLAGGDSRLEAGMAALYDTFRDAPLLGSLINPTRSAPEDMLTAGFSELEPLLDQALRKHTGEEEWEEAAIAARGITDAARLLCSRYHLVITNVPYLARSKQNDQLRKFAETYYPKAKNDLANIFLERCIELSLPNEVGIVQIVMPQNWLYLTTYQRQRERLLSLHSWKLLAKLGFASFQVMYWWAFGIVLLSLQHRAPAETELIAALDCSSTKDIIEKSRILETAPLTIVPQQSQLRNPDSRVTLTEVRASKTIGQVASALQGIKTGDDGQHILCFWELPTIRRGWKTIQSTVDTTILYGGLQRVLRWRDEGVTIARLQGRAAWGKPGVAVSLMNELRSALFIGQVFDSNVSVVTPRDSRILPSLWAYCSSSELNRAVKEIEPGVKANNGVLAKVEFDQDIWSKEASRLYPQGLPLPYSDDPSQWIFHGHPKPVAFAFQVAAARLLGYRWPAENDPNMELANEARAWIEKTKVLYSFEDEDGIVCLPSVRGEPSAHERLLHLLEAAWVDAWNEGVLAKLLADSGAGSLDDWLRNQFFEEHCKLFHYRPFIWHIWDGRKRDGFHALVNYHKLAAPNGEGRKLLESLTYSYLGDWINRQRDGVKRGEGGADDRLAVALELEKRLKAILEGQPPFDIFIRWKPIDRQPIGWEPDINDGVRLNIRPFFADDLPNGRKGAGILRWKPNIHWKKDRGKEPIRPQEQYPWFWENGKFMGNRVNDVHLTNDEKRQARDSE